MRKCKIPTHGPIRRKAFPNQVSGLWVSGMSDSESSSYFRPMTTLETGPWLYSPNQHSITARSLTSPNIVQCRLSKYLRHGGFVMRLLTTPWPWVCDLDDAGKSKRIPADHSLTKVKIDAVSCLLSIDYQYDIK